jgi:hypothetical protein
MAVSNALAYYDTAKITALKSFIVQAPAEEKITLGDATLKLFQP